MDATDVAIKFLSDLPANVMKQRVLMHKYLAYSFVYMAKANKLSGHVGLHRQYIKFAADHLAHAKRLKALVPYLEN